MSCGVPQLLDSALAHHGHAVRHAERFVLVMRDVEKRHPDLTLNTPKLRLHGLTQLPIQGPQGLVQQEHVGLQHQGTRQSHALLLPAAELVWTARLQTGQLHQVEHGLDTSRDFRLGQASALHPQAEGDVVLDSEMREQGVMLKHNIDAAGIGRLVVHRAANADLTAVGVSSPPIRRNVVVLPQPLGPSRAKNSPW